MPPGPGPVGHRAEAARGRRPRPEGGPTRPRAKSRGRGTPNSFHEYTNYFSLSTRNQKSRRKDCCKCFSRRRIRPCRRTGDRQDRVRARVRGGAVRTRVGAEPHVFHCQYPRIAQLPRVPLRLLPAQEQRRASPRSASTNTRAPTAWCWLSGPICFRIFPENAVTIRLVDKGNGEREIEIGI